MKKIKIEEGFLRCRTLGHAWDQTEIPFQRNGVFGRRGYTGARMSFRCVSCGTVRHDIISPSSGELIYRKYAYPMGYSMDAGHKPTRDEFRREMFVREIRRLKKT